MSHKTIQIVLKLSKLNTLHASMIINKPENKPSQFRIAFTTLECKGMVLVLFYILSCMIGFLAMLFFYYAPIFIITSLQSGLPNVSYFSIFHTLKSPLTVSLRVKNIHIYLFVYI